MAKKIRFLLEMDNGVEVRSMEELRDNFSVVRVMGYIKDGKLCTWLRDRYMDDLADAVEQLDLTDAEIVKKISEIFDVPFHEISVHNMEKATERIERLKHLKEYTDEQKYQDVIDQVAFDQDELYDLLDDGITTIYLCGERFSIPLAKPGIAYIGINQPIAVIDSKVEVDWQKKQISVEGMVFDDRYQAVLNSAHLLVEHKSQEEPISEANNAREMDEGVIALFKEIVDEKKKNSYSTNHKYYLLGYNDDFLIYCETWRNIFSARLCINYRYSRKNHQEEQLNKDFTKEHCCVYKDKLFSALDYDKSYLYVSNLDGSGKKRLLTKEYTYGLPQKATVEDDVICVYYQKPGDKDDVWKSEWYDLKENHEWEALNDDSVGIYSI